MADVVHRAKSVIAQFEEGMRVLSPGARKKVAEIVEKRSALLFSGVNLLAYVFDPHYRGQALTLEEKRKVLRNLDIVCEKLNLTPPNVQDVWEFMGRSGFFSDVERFESMSSFIFWNCAFKDSSMSPIGRILASLPSSQASVERIFSGASWVVDGRERLNAETLFKEVFVRANILSLKRSGANIAL